MGDLFFVDIRHRINRDFPQLPDPQPAASRPPVGERGSFLRASDGKGRLASSWRTPGCLLCSLPLETIQICQCFACPTKYAPAGLFSFPSRRIRFRSSRISFTFPIFTPPSMTKSAACPNWESWQPGSWTTFRNASFRLFRFWEAALTQFFNRGRNAATQGLWISMTMVSMFYG